MIAGHTRMSHCCAWAALVGIGALGIGIIIPARAPAQTVQQQSEKRLEAARRKAAYNERVKIGRAAKKDAWKQKQDAYKIVKEKKEEAAEGRKAAYNERVKIGRERKKAAWDQKRNAFKMAQQRKKAEELEQKKHHRL